MLVVCAPARRRWTSSSCRKPRQFILGGGGGWRGGRRGQMAVVVSCCSAPEGVSPWKGCLGGCWWYARRGVRAGSVVRAETCTQLSWGEVAAGGDGDGDRWRSFSAVAPPLGEVDPGKGSVGVAGGVCDGACELEAWIVSTSFSLGILSLL